VNVIWSLPHEMQPSQALDYICDLAEDCIADDGELVMTQEDGLGFVEILRTIARAARLAEQRASDAPSPILCGNVVDLRPRKPEAPWVVDGGGNVA